MTAGALVAAAAVAMAAWAIGDHRPRVLAGPRVPRPRRSRPASAEREVPMLLDLFASATSGGLAGPIAFRNAVAALTGPLGERLTPIVSDLSLGPDLGPGVRSVGEELELPELVSVGSILERSGSLGTPITDAVRELAIGHRRSRRRRAEEQARRAPVRMLFPLVLLILPAFLLLTVIPLLVATLGSLS